MKVKVNGEDREVDPASTVETLLAELGLADQAAGLAVAVDRMVVPKSEYAIVTLAEDAEIEILRAVGGG